MRAREPDRVGYVERDGVRVGYEVFGSAGPAIIFLPSWQILHSRQWKLQAPYLARYMRVITYDARGNGRSDRPAQAERYAHREIVADAVAVLDAVGVDEAVFAGTSMGALYGLQAAAWYPERVRAVVAIGSVAPYVAAGRAGGEPVLRRRCGGQRRRVLRRTRPAGLPRVRRVLHGRGDHRAAPHEAGRGRGRLGPGDDPGGARAHRRRPGGRRPRRRSRTCAGRCAARCWWCTATRTGSSRTSTVWRWPSCWASGSSRSRAAATCRRSATRCAATC